jgi:hypothetical protein
VSPSRGDISLGDAVVAACTLGAADPVDLVAIVQTLDLRFGAVPETPVEVEPEEEPPGVVPPPPDAGIAPPERALAGPVWDDVIVTSHPATGADRAPPSWAEGERVDFRGPAEPPDPSPPLPRELARAAMAAVVATRRVGSEPDLEWIVRRAARVEPVAPPRLLVEVRTAPAVWLLADRGEGMEPFSADIRFLAAELTAVAGSDRIERHTFVGTPARGIDPDPFTGECTPWKLPSEGVLLVVLSDLGTAPAGDAASEAEWAAFARSVETAGATLRALTPFARERRPPALTRTAGWE